ncbi:hypothetical protein AB0L57_01840 [Nocardia sp. NPDC052254]|uniref:hypothetical protein n=1 Tax=Nocardia sp. NPDC052254 TaxID=3155681 RepID=UPI00342254D7
MGTNPNLKRIRWIAAGVLVTAAGAVGGISAQLAAGAPHSAPATTGQFVPLPAAPDRTVSNPLPHGRNSTPVADGDEVAVAGWSPTTSLRAADTDSDTDTSGS